MKKGRTPRRSTVRGADTLLLGPEAVKLGDLLGDLSLAFKGCEGAERGGHMNEREAAFVRSAALLLQEVIRSVKERDPWRETKKSRTRKY